MKHLTHVDMIKLWLQYNTTQSTDIQVFGEHNTAKHNKRRSSDFKQPPPEQNGLTYYQEHCPPGPCDWHHENWTSQGSFSLSWSPCNIISLSGLLQWRHPQCPRRQEGRQVPQVRPFQMQVRKSHHVVSVPVPSLHSCLSVLSYPSCWVNTTTMRSPSTSPFAEWSSGRWWPWWTSSTSERKISMQLTFL